MSIAPNLDDLPPDVPTELKSLKVRVTQGFPAFESLRRVLTEAEWQQEEAELQQYFPPPTAKKAADAVAAKADESAEATFAAGSPPLETTATPPIRPPYYAIRILMKLRKMSQCRAILELALATDLLTEAGYRRLLKAIGEPEAPALAPGPQEARPAEATLHLEWDKALSQLRLNGEVIKQVRGSTVAKNIVAILNAFQEQGWPRHTDDPLPGGRDQKRLHDAILSLNRDLQGIRFRADGTGAGVCWDAAPSP